MGFRRRLKWTSLTTPIKREVRTLLAGEWMKLVRKYTGNIQNIQEYTRSCASSEVQDAWIKVSKWVIFVL